jgi:hypothetical protein
MNIKQKPVGTICTENDRGERIQLMRFQDPKTGELGVKKVAGHIGVGTVWYDQIMKGVTLDEAEKACSSLGRQYPRFLTNFVIHVLFNSLSRNQYLVSQDEDEDLKTGSFIWANIQHDDTSEGRAISVVRFFNGNADEYILQDNAGSQLFSHFSPLSGFKLKDIQMLRGDAICSGYDSSSNE